jgi:hypothetical protein
MFYRMCRNIGVTWLITLEGQHRLWVLGTLIYEGVNLERGGKTSLNHYLRYMHPFPPPLPEFFHLPFFNSITKRKLSVE